MEKNNNQRYPEPPGRRSSRPGRQEHSHKGRPDSRTEPSEHLDANHEPGAATGQETKPITNQDEQRKATNAGNTSDIMGERETEGD